MPRASLVLALGALMVVSVQGCASATLPECAFQVPGFGGYAVKMTLKTPTTGCPASIGDVWYTEGYSNATLWIWNSGSDDTVSTVRPASDPAFGQGTFKNPFPDPDGTCTMESITPFVVRSTTPNSAPSGTYTVTNLRSLGGAVYSLQEFEADVSFTGGTCTGGQYLAQGMAPPVQCTADAASACDPSAQPPNAINAGFNQGCVTDGWAFSAAVAQNKANDLYNCYTESAGCVSGIDATHPELTPQPDPGTGLCFLKADYPSFGSYQP
ncbi:MAG TPA: hypothetical protein VLT82_05000 [Myxococcaceae bacterium]|nr:hypothetical protein [Myxococcaceae bacterium]